MTTIVTIDMGGTGATHAAGAREALSVPSITDMGQSYAQANSGYAQANAAYNQANNARSDANTTFATVNSTFATVNTNYQAAYAQANTARSDANTTFATVNTTFGTVNTNYQAAYTQANTARSDANTTFATVNTTFGTINTNYQAAYAQANTARTTANDAYAAANTKLGTAGGSISGDLSITGNLTVQGNATTINVSNLSVNDSIILLAAGGTGDSLDVGFVGHIQRGATNTHVGLIRKATQNQFYLFDNYEVEPTNNVIDVAGNNFTVGNLRLGIINANSYVTSAGLDVTGQANAAYSQANTARSDANTTFATINTTFATLNTSAATQNTNIGNSYDQANTARGQANTAYGQANSAFGQANAAYSQANSAFGQANAAYGQANNAYGAANNRVLKAGDTMTGNLTMSGSYIITGNQASTTSGSRLLAGNYGNGALATIGGEQSTGAIFLGYGVWANTTTQPGFISSTGAAVQRGAYVASADHRWYTGGSQTVAENGTVTMSERMRIQNDGNVGIGTASAATLLDTLGSASLGTTVRSGFNKNTTSGLYAYQTNNNGSFEIGVTVGGSSGPSGANANSRIGFYADSTQIGTYNAIPLTFLTNGSERARIDSSGNVGIGTTSPATKLDVRGIIQGQTYSVPDTGATAQWIKLGTLTMPQLGYTARIRAYIHAGFNANNNQDFYLDIFFKTSNGSSVDGNGFAGNSWYYTHGFNASDPQIKWKANAAGVSATTYELFMYLPNYTFSSHYIVEIVEGVTWAHAGSTGQTDPGSGSSTVCVSSVGLNIPLGNFGIGITTPQSKLEVATSSGNFSHFGATSTASGQFTGITLGYRENNSSYRKAAIVQEQIADNAARGHLHLLVDIANDAGSVVLGDSKLMIHGTTGNVGIGTTNPGEKFEVSGGNISYKPSVGNSLRLGDDQTYGTSGTGRYTTLGFSAMVNGGNRIFAHNTGQDGLYLCSATSTSVSIRAGGSASDQTVFTSAGAVGVGTTSPSVKFHVVGDARIGAAATGGSAAGNLYIAGNRLWRWIAGYSPDYGIGNGFGLYDDTGGVYRFTIDPSGNVGINTTAPGLGSGGTGLDISGSTYTQLRVRASVAGYSGGIEFKPFTGNMWEIQATTSNTFIVYDRGQSQYRWTIASSGNVSIGWNNDSDQGYKLAVNGTLYVGSTITEASSATIKQNISPINNALNSISKLVGVTYDRKDGSGKNKAGLIAEEVEQVLPNVVQKDENGNPTGIQYTNLIAYLVESIKELKAEIDVLKSK